MRPASFTKASFGAQEQCCVLRLAGAVRHPQARALRQVIDDVVLKSPAETVFVDLTDVEAIDSTGLGLLARIGRHAAEHHGRRAVLVCPSSDLGICLRSAAFDQLFQLVDEFPYDPLVEVRELPLEQAAALPLEDVVLDAHRELLAASDDNKEAFADVVALLEAEMKKPHA